MWVARASFAHLACTVICFKLSLRGFFLDHHFLCDFKHTLSSFGIIAFESFEPDFASISCYSLASICVVLLQSMLVSALCCQHSRPTFSTSQYIGSCKDIVLDPHFHSANASFLPQPFRVRLDPAAWFGKTLRRNPIWILRAVGPFPPRFSRLLIVVHSHFWIYY